ncbi:hypothetical protein Acr_00g0041960 [Actinidia rufa]|uniref:Uncharacterized protein n=1 Tax=Actinidia rufa TaxID=165716 RepID=A0A7J0DI99_9ERIC|nr:hypothetical protein Acr_00g0041960 [Actinidia rufa]
MGREVAKVRMGCSVGVVLTKGAGEKMGCAANSGGDGGNGARQCTPRVEEVEDIDIWK